MRTETLIGVVIMLGSITSCTPVHSPEKVADSRGLQEATSVASDRQKLMTQHPLVAESRALEVESAARLAAEGALLFQADRIPRTGYEYCSSAVQLIEQGELRLGIREASKALFLGQKNRDPDVLAYAYRDLAYAYSLAGDLERAAQFADEAITHMGRSPGPYHDRGRVLGPSYKIRGDVHLRQGRFSEALKDYQQALKASESSFQPLVLSAMANASLASGDLSMARQLFQKAEASVSDALRPLIRRGLGHVALAEGRHQDALRWFTEAAAQLTGPDQGYHRLWALDGIARAQLAAGDRSKATEAYMQAVAEAERVRAKFRSEEFKTGFFGDIQRIFDAAVALLMETAQVEAAFEVSERSRARALLDLVRGRVQLSAGAVAFADPLGQAVSAAQLRAALPEGIVVVAYHVLPHRSYAWVIRRSAISPLVLDVSQETLAHAVRRFRESIRGREPQAPQLAAELYTQLMSRIEFVKDEAVVLVPHDVLHYLPFQALRGVEGFLIEERPVSYAPSASILMQLLTRRERPRERLLALGNPDLGTPRLALPGAQLEVERLRTLFPGAEVYVQQEATKERLMARAAQSDLLHIAAHAEVDAIDPLYSGILLASTAQVPGRMEAHEVYRIDLSRTSLATLSACDTGLGRVSRGDEIWGFTRAFLSAGPQALLVSLWPVHDEATAQLMARFYEELSHHPAPWALRAAQIEVLRDGRFRHPFFWAPFNFIGDWR